MNPDAALPVCRNRHLQRLSPLQRYAPDLGVTLDGRSQYQVPAVRCPLGAGRATAGEPEQLTRGPAIYRHDPKNFRLSSLARNESEPAPVGRERQVPNARRRRRDVERLLLSSLQAPQANLRTHHIEDALAVGRPDSFEPAKSGQFVLDNRSDSSTPGIDT